MDTKEFSTALSELSAFPEPITEYALSVASGITDDARASLFKDLQEMHADLASIEEDLGETIEEAQEAIAKFKKDELPKVRKAAEEMEHTQKMSAAEHNLDTAA